MNEHEKINYVEFPSKDLAVTKAFFAAVFGWSFVDYGPDYTAFSDAGLDGGFFKIGFNGFCRKRWRPDCVLQQWTGRNTIKNQGCGRGDDQAGFFIPGWEAVSLRRPQRQRVRGVVRYRRVNRVGVIDPDAPLDWP